MSIARYFGPEASYDAIKSFFAKEVSKAAGQIKAANPEHRGSCRGIPPRVSAGPSRRPPHLYFNDEDISVLTQREVEAVEARFGHSLRAPTKRPRIVKASPRPSPGPEVTYAASASEPPHTSLTPTPDANVQQVPSSANHVASALSHSTLQSDAYHTALEDCGPSRKRPFSEVQDSIEPQGTEHFSPSAPPQTESFGYVTNQGQFRCALCFSQLPSQEDLDRHERVSREHLKNLRTEPKLAKGREKLAQVTAVPAIEGQHNTPVPLQSLRTNGVSEPAPPQLIRETSIVAEQIANVRDETPSDTQASRRFVSLAHPRPDADATTHSAQNGIGSTAIDKGKGRVASHASPLPPPQSNAPTTPERYTQPQTPSTSPSPAQTRPTTARTEIGTISTPHTVKNPFMAPPQPPQVPLATSKPSAFSVNELADVMRSTEIILQLMGCVQREAKAVAASHSESTSFDSGVQMRPGNADGVGGQNGDTASTNLTTTSDSGTQQSSDASAASHGYSRRAPHAISAPGIDVYTGMRREAGQATEGKGKGKQKDTGSEVSFIVLE